MGAPGTIVEGAEKPVMRAVVVAARRVRREVKVVRRVGRRILLWVVWRILGCLVVGFGFGWCSCRLVGCGGRLSRSDGWTMIEEGM